MILTGIGISAVLTLIVWLLIVGLIFGVVWWGVDYLVGKGFPGIFATIIKVVMVVAVLLFIINILLGLIGEPSIHV